MGSWFDLVDEFLDWSCPAEVSVDVDERVGRDAFFAKDLSDKTVALKFLRGDLADGLIRAVFFD